MRSRQTQENGGFHLVADARRTNRQHEAVEGLGELSSSHSLDRSRRIDGSKSTHCNRNLRLPPTNTTLTY